MANEYATVPELKQTLSLDGETFADADIARALEAASRGLDGVCQRRFYPDPDANQVRYYTPDIADVLMIDDLIELTAVASDPDGDGTFQHTWVLNSDFVLEPLNAEADGEPWTKVRVHPRGSRFLPVCAPRSVRVTGRFGWEAVPMVVTQATIVVASKLLMRARQAPFGVASFDGGEAFRIARSDPDVAFLIGPLKRYVVAIA